MLSCDPAARKVTLTLKKQLLKMELPAITCLADAKAGTRAYGVVTGVKDFGVFVGFFGGITGLIRSADLGLKPGEDPKVRFLPRQPWHVQHPLQHVTSQTPQSSLA